MHSHAHTRPRQRGITLILTIALLALMPASPARAQQGTDDDAQREIVRLRREVARLRRDLAEADVRIRELQARNDRLESMVQQARQTIAELRRALRERPEPDPTPQPRTAPIPDDPQASPWSMLRELTKRYESAFGDAPETRSEREVEQWCTRVEKELGGRTTWLVRVVELIEPDSSTRDQEAWIEVLDPASREPIGKPVRVEGSRDFARAVERDLFPLWEVTVDFTPGAHFNPDRRDRGAFNVPPFIGPMVEFRPRIVIARHTGVEPEQNEQNDSPESTRSESPERTGGGRDRSDR